MSRPRSWRCCATKASRCIPVSRFSVCRAGPEKPSASKSARQTMRPSKAAISWSGPDAPLIRTGCDDDVAPVAEGLHRFADVARPQIAIAHLGATNSVEVVHVVGDILGHVEHAELREVHQHFRWRFGAWRQ